MCMKIVGYHDVVLGIVTRHLGALIDTGKYSGLLDDHPCQPILASSHQLLRAQCEMVTKLIGLLSLCKVNTTCINFISTLSQLRINFILTLTQS